MCTISQQRARKCSLCQTDTSLYIKVGSGCSSLTSIPVNVPSRIGPIYVVERELDRRASGARVVLARAATPELTSSPCFTLCEPNVAIKIVPHTPVGKRSAFNVEHEIAALRLAQGIPGVVDIVECMSDEHYTYIVMPYFEGGNLFSLVVDKGGLSEEITCKVFTSVVRTLLALQQQCSLAHHDISLDNMMIDKDGQIHIIDLGLSVKVPGNCLATVLVVPHLYGGKKSYIAPEIVSMKSVIDVYAADVWSLGICLYNMLTCRPLYNKPNDSTYIRMLKRNGVRKVIEQEERRCDKYLSSKVKHLLCWMLEVDPKLRPTFQQILDHAFVTGKDDPTIDSNEIKYSKSRLPRWRSFLVAFFSRFLCSFGIPVSVKSTSVGPNILFNIVP